LFITGLVFIVIFIFTERLLLVERENKLLYNIASSYREAWKKTDVSYREVLESSRNTEIFASDVIDGLYRFIKSRNIKASPYRDASGELSGYINKFVKDKDGQYTIYFDEVERYTWNNGDNYVAAFEDNECDPVKSIQSYVCAYTDPGAYVRNKKVEFIPYKLMPNVKIDMLATDFPSDTSYYLEHMYQPEPASIGLVNGKVAKIIFTSP